MLLPFQEEQSGIFSVSELNAGIRSVLEATYPFIWVRGEISNFRIPASGHCYFTLKDDQSQIRAVLFRVQHRQLRFIPESGIQVLCRCRLSVYEPRGEYQLIVETMEPQGLGALQLAFEQLKGKLQAEGLFDAARKRPLPVCPRKIAIVTSSTGAAIRDILKVFRRSLYPLSVTIFPVRVQGAGASAEIAAAIKNLNKLAERFDFDVALVGRGGGSLEDLWPFNEEVVARALARCRIPTISAVGHEIDFTISDLAADLRAATPTAAAEWVVSRMESFDRGLLQNRDALLHALSQRIADSRHHLRYLEKGLVDPKRRLTDLRLLLDDRLDRLQISFDRHLERLRTLHAHLKEKLDSAQPMKSIQQHKTFLERQSKDIAMHYERILDSLRLQLQEYASQLDGLNPLAVLARGYSITYRLSDNKVIRKSTQIQPGQGVRVRLAEGSLECTVEKTE
ncbi:MAG: exodeoxyribonuclease VII large subunit [Syntrophobacteraceae bacterium]